MDSDMQHNNAIPSPPMQIPMKTNMQQVVNYAISTAIPALITVVDERVGTILKTAVSTMEAAANRVEVATQKRVHNPRRSHNKQPVIDEYDGDTEVTPTKYNGLKSTKINKQHVRFQYLIILFLNNLSFLKGIYQEVAWRSGCPPYEG